MRTSDAIRHGLSPFPGAQKNKIPLNKLRDGLLTLNTLWSKSIHPNELRGHFLLTWFAIERGRVLRLARCTKIHRNTLIILITRYTGKLCYKLRTYWFAIQKKNPQLSFPSQFYLFLIKALNKTSITPKENDHLVDLWLMGFPDRILRVHYVLWAYKEGRTREEVCKILGISRRTLYRVSSSNAKKGSPAYKWLAPMKIKEMDFYPPKAKNHH